MKKRLRLPAVMLAAVLAATGGPPPVFADALSDMEQRQQALQQQLDEANRNLAALDGQVDKQEAYNAQLLEQLDLSQQQVDLMGEQIIAVSDSIALKREEIAFKEDQIASYRQQIGEAEAEIAGTLEQFKVRMRALYVAGEMTSLQMLLSSDSFADFYLNAALMQAVSRSDEELVAKLKKQKLALEEQKAALEAAQAQLEADMAELEAQLADLSSRQEELRTAQAALSADYEKNRELLAAYQAEADAARADRGSLRKELDQVDAEMQAWFAEQERIRKEKEEEERRRREEERLKAEEERRKAEEEAASRGESLPPVEDDGFDDDEPVNEVHTMFAWPIPGFSKIWCSYGQQDGYFHYGIDISDGGINGADILAAESGIVLIAATHYSYGNYVILDHGGGYATLYAHASALCVSAGETVSRGQLIAKVGSTGNSSGPHLHFEVRVNGQTQNPLGFVSP